MIEVVFTRKLPEMRLKASGHSGYAEKGQDIICAGVSAIMLTAAEGMLLLADEGRATDVQIRLRDGASCVSGKVFFSGEAIMRAAAAALRKIAQGAPEHVSYREE